MRQTFLSVTEVGDTGIPVGSTDKNVGFTPRPAVTPAFLPVQDRGSFLSAHKQECLCHSKPLAGLVPNIDVILQDSERDLRHDGFSPPLFLIPQRLAAVHATAFGGLAIPATVLTLS